jgi:hypothetical protein
MRSSRVVDDILPSVDKCFVSMKETETSKIYGHKSYDVNCLS